MSRQRARRRKDKCSTHIRMSDADEVMEEEVDSAEEEVDEVHIKARTLIFCMRVEAVEITS